MSAGDCPMEAFQAKEILIGQKPSLALIHTAAEKASSVDIDPGSDIHASAEFRRHLANVLTRRALSEAFTRALGNLGKLE